MSTGDRVVPVKLQAGKEYVLRNGRHVKVVDNPHWQARQLYPFAVIQGPDFVVYFKDDGSVGDTAGLHEHDIVRPVYKVGAVYLSRGAAVPPVKLVVDDNDSSYPFEDAEGYSWTRDGFMYGPGHPNSRDLMDYAPEILAVPDSGWVGKRVSFREGSRVAHGYVKEQRTPTQCYVEVDAPFVGHGVNGRMWFVDCVNMTEVPELVMSGTGTATGNVKGGELAVEHAEPCTARTPPGLELPSPGDAPASAVGRSLVLAMNGREYAATVIGADRWYYTIEFAEGESVPGMWYCNGQCPSGRGWMLNHADEGTLFRFVEAVAQPQAESSEALDDDDRAACWAAFVQHPHIWIDQWVAARKELRRA